MHEPDAPICPECHEPLTLLIIEDAQGEVIAASWVCHSCDPESEEQ